ncbi:hypothetical protein Tco_1313670 [Tanacetum coccineum]
MENSKKGYTPMMEKPDYRKSQGAKTPTEVQRMLRVPYALAIDMVLVYGAKLEDDLKVFCYADASFQTDKDDTKSLTGYVFVLNGGVIDWKSVKQSTTAMSSTKAEYIDADEAKHYLDFSLLIIKQFLVFFVKIPPLFLLFHSL